MLHDLRIALRSWLKSPLFVVVAIGTMAVAIGANTMVFSLINTVLMRDLPYPNGDRAFSVTQRSREIGIRMALGATRRDILTLILRQGLKLLAIGVAAGLVLSIAGGRLLASQLYGVAPHDAISLGLAALVVSVATLLGCWLPARRATLVSPLRALRTD